MAAQTPDSRTSQQTTSTSGEIDRRILRFDPVARRSLYVVVAAGLLDAGLVVGGAIVLSRTISYVFIGGRSLDQVSWLLVALLLVAAARAGVIAFRDWLAAASAQRLKSSLRGRLVAHLAELGPLFTRGERAGRLASIATQGIEELDAYFAVYQPVRHLIVLVPVLIGVAVLVIDPLSVLVLLATGPLLVLLLVLIGGRARELTQRRFDQLGWMSAYFLDMLQGLPTLKMFGRSREQAARIREISRGYGSATMDVLRTAFETALVIEMSATIATALVAVETGLRLAHGSMQYESALAVLLLTPEFFQPLRQLSLSYHAGAAGRTAAAAVFELLDAPPAARSVVRSAESAVPVGTIRFDNVSASYEQGTRPALAHVSLELAVGGRLLIVGASGAGKSTIANLLLRTIEPDGGSITVGGRPLASIERAAWLGNIAWVPQHPHLFATTVAENIALGKPDASRKAVVDAAKNARAHDFVTRLPYGYDTVIGERGVRLSGGERQRIAIARAFLKDAPILILDEPASHLDPANEALVRDSLTRLLAGRTALIIAHDAAIVPAASMVVVLHEGRVVRTGRSDAQLREAAPA